MSHEQLRRPYQEPIKHAQVFSGMDDNLTGQSPRGGLAVAPNMQYEHAGLAGFDDLIDRGEDQSVSIAETVVPGRGFITESVHRQVGKHRQPEPLAPPLSGFETGTITIGEALEGSILRAGDKPIDKTYTAAIQAAEDARERLPVDKPVTHRDAEGVIAAKLRNNPNLKTYPGGVADPVASAARLNQQNKSGLKQD